MELVYLANIIVAGWISISSLFFTDYAAAAIFSGAYQRTDIIKLVGCLWLGIAVLSVFGLFRPMEFSPVLVLQLIYKAVWLLVVALPAINARQAYPAGMAVFFVIWVMVLPFVIPWKYLIGF